MERIAVLLVLIIIGNQFVALDVDITGEKLAVSYSFDLAKKYAQICINLRPQSLYFWESEKLITLKRLDYAAFSKSDDLVIKVSLTLRDRGGTIVNYATGCRLNDNASPYFFRNGYLELIGGCTANKNTHFPPVLMLSRATRIVRLGI